MVSSKEACSRDEPRSRPQNSNLRLWGHVVACLVLLANAIVLSTSAQAQTPASPVPISRTTGSSGNNGKADAKHPQLNRDARPPLLKMNSVKGLEAYIASVKKENVRREAKEQQEEKEREAARARREKQVARKGRPSEKETKNETKAEREREAKHAVARKDALKHGNVAMVEDESKEAGVDYLEAYLYWFKQRAYPNDTIDFEAYQGGIKQRNRMPAGFIGNRPGGGRISVSSITGNTWNFLGPTNLPVPYNIYYGQGFLNGRINAVAYDPSNPSTTYYIATSGGGVWKTTNSGSSWTPLSDTWQTLQTSSIAIDPTNSNVIYVGTGDFDGYGAYGNGIMKSTNGGVSWTNLGSAQFTGFAVSAIVIDPENTQIITVTLGRGPTFYGYIYRSTDGGTTWTRVLNTYPLQIYTAWSDLDYGAKDGSGNRYYYASGLYNNGQVWRSADRGATWTQLTTPMSTGNFGNQGGVEIAASPNNSNTVYLISGFDKKIWKSTNAGGSWTDITTGFPAGNSSVGTTYNWSQYDYDIHLECVTGASGQDVLYVGLIDLAQSQDGGATWRSIGGPTYGNGTSLIHNDQHALVPNPTNVNEALVCNDGGIFRLTINSSNQPTYVSLNGGLGITQFYRSAFHPTNSTRILGGAQDNATPVSTGSLSSWLNRGGGDGGFVAINPANPNVQYTTAQSLSFYYTTNNWSSSASKNPSTTGDTVAFIAPIAINPLNPNLVYGGTNYLDVYTASTNTWSNHLGNQTLASSNNYTQYIGVSSSDVNRIYTGASDGQVWMSTNGGTAWTQINTGTPALPNRAITQIEVSASNPSDILVTVSSTGTGHLWRCANTLAGASRVWTDLSGANVNTQLPDSPANSVAIDSDDPTKTFYVATDIGVFMTTDGGANWSNVTAPLRLPNVQVNDLHMIAGTRYLNAATYGRGIWNIKLATVVSTLTVNPISVVGGNSVSGTFTLTDPAPTGGLTVTLASDNPKATVAPTSVFVAAGASTANFTINTSSVVNTTTANISATVNSITKTTPLTLLPAPMVQFAITTTLTRNASNVVANVVVTNIGNLPATQVVLTGASMRNQGTATTANGALLPFTVGDLAAGASQTVTLNFPTSIGNTGATVLLRLSGNYGRGQGSIGSSGLYTLP